MSSTTNSVPHSTLHLAPFSYSLQSSSACPHPVPFSTNQARQKMVCSQPVQPVILNAPVASKGEIAKDSPEGQKRRTGGLHPFLISWACSSLERTGVPTEAVVWVASQCGRQIWMWSTPCRFTVSLQPQLEALASIDSHKLHTYFIYLLFATNYSETQPVI